MAARSRRRLVLGAIASAGLAVGSGQAFATVHTCKDPITGVMTKTDTECPVARAPTTTKPTSGAGADVPISPEARRVDWQLLNKYPDEAAHRKALMADLEPVFLFIGQSMKRLDELKVARKRLDEDAEFYRGKPLPPKLQREIDANDASFRALVDVFRGLETDATHIGAKYAHLREHLRKLWAGAPPGSIGLFVPLSTT